MSEYTNINSITIDRNDSPQKRLQSYIEQVKDPYSISIDSINVRLCFNGDDRLEDKLIRIYSSF